MSPVPAMSGTPRRSKHCGAPLSRAPRRNGRSSRRSTGHEPAGIRGERLGRWSGPQGRPPDPDSAMARAARRDPSGAATRAVYQPCLNIPLRIRNSARDVVALSRLVQRRGAGVGSRRARSRVNAGVVSGPGCRPFTGHFIGRVLRDRLHANTGKSASYAAKCPVRVPFRAQHPLGAVVNRPSVWSDR